MTDLQIIKQIEKELSIELKELDVIDWNSIGYTLSKENKVSGFGLYKHQVKDFKSIVPFLNKLNKLTRLSLSDTKSADYLFLKEFKKLTFLGLSFNQISDISVLKDLKNLTKLYLSDNQISDISVLENLKNLTWLDLSRNQISELPVWITDFNMEMDWRLGAIILKGNPITNPPLEIVKQGKRAIKNWFFAKKKKLNEVKVILIGKAEAGKTSLLRRLKKDEYNPKEQQTDGIIIENFDFRNLKTFKKQQEIHGIKAYFWDFGGQEIMSSTHQFFLTNRSVYILVLEARNDEKADLQVQEWLKHIQTFGGNSPVIVVANKIDLNEAFGINTYELKNDFPQIKAFHNISCQDNTGIEELKDDLAKFIPQAELFKTKIDERWFPIKDELQKLTSKKQYIKQKEYEAICNRNGLSDPDEQIEAVKFLNDLGIVLHFSKLRMSEYFVLDPHWVTTGVYKIITSAFAAKAKGEILFSDLDYIVNKEASRKKGYKSSNHQKIKYYPNELSYLSEIMAEFKLSYFSENREKILIPDLLDKETPAKAVEMFNKIPDKLNLIFKYEYLPYSIIHFFMVEIKRDIKKAWRTGVLLKCKSNIDAEAMVVASGNKISISVAGEHRQKRDYMSIIRFFLDKVNSDYTLKTTMQIPLGDIKGETVSYKQLSNMDKSREAIYKDWETEKEYNIASLLNGIVRPEIIQKQAQTINNMYIIGDNNSPFQNVTAGELNFRGKSKEEIMHLLYERFLNGLDGLHARHDKNDANQELQLSLQKASQKALEKLSSAQQEISNTIILEIEKNRAAFFETKSEEKEFRTLVNTFIAEIKDEKEAEKAKKLLDNSRIDMTSKLKFGIPFIIGKYEIEFATKNKVPRNWKEFKALFVREA